MLGVSKFELKNRVADVRAMAENLRRDLSQLIDRLDKTKLEGLGPVVQGQGSRLDAGLAELGLLLRLLKDTGVRGGPPR